MTVDWLNAMQLAEGSEPFLTLQKFKLTVCQLCHQVTSDVLGIGTQSPNLKAVIHDIFWTHERCFKMIYCKLGIPQT